MQRFLVILILNPSINNNLMCNDGNYDNSLLYTIHVMSTFHQIIIENAV